MSNTPTAPESKPHNGHRTVGAHAADPDVRDDEAEPKGTPHSDRYRAETAHASEAEQPKARTRPGQK